MNAQGTDTAHPWLDRVLTRRPLVSIVVPCHGEGRYLDDCLHSLRHQTHRELEIVVIDDAGTDDSVSVALDHALDDPRVTVWRARRNVGLGAIRNVALSLVRGDLVGFVDGDDLVPPRSVAARVEALADWLERPGIDPRSVVGVYGDWEYVTERVHRSTPGHRARPLVPVDLRASGGGNVCIVSAPLVRPDLLRSAGGFAEGLGGGEDYLAWMRLLARGGYLAPCRELVASYRQKSSSMVRTSAGEYATLAAAGRRWFRDVVAQAPPANPVELAELAAGEHTIEFGTAVDRRPRRPAIARHDLAEHTPAPRADPGPPPAGGAHASADRAALARLFSHPPVPSTAATVPTVALGAIGGVIRPRPAIGEAPAEPVLTIVASSWSEGTIAAAASALCGAAARLAVTTEARHGALAVLVHLDRIDSVEMHPNPGRAASGVALRVVSTGAGDVRLLDVDGATALTGAALLGALPAAFPTRFGVGTEKGTVVVVVDPEAAPPVRDMDVSDPAPAVRVVARSSRVARAETDRGNPCRGMRISDLLTADVLVVSDPQVRGLAAALRATSTGAVPAPGDGGVDVDVPIGPTGVRSRLAALVADVSGR